MEKSLGGGIQATLFDHLLNEGIGGILGFASARYVRAPICSKERITRLHKNPDTLRVTGKSLKLEEEAAFMSNIRQAMGSLRRKDPSHLAGMTLEDRVRAGAARYVDQIKHEATSRKENIIKQVLRQDERIREMVHLCEEESV